jgi:hypothetical protein
MTDCGVGMVAILTNGTADISGVPHNAKALGPRGRFGSMSK